MNKVQIMDKNKIKYLVMDVDGTLTDGKVYMGNNGEVCKAFNIKDGCGIKDIAVPFGLIPIIISGRQSNIVINRCEELGISEIHQKVDNKTEKLLEIVTDLSRVAFIGDDINDLPCMNEIKKAGGIVGCPKDAAKTVIQCADYVTERRGGEGAVRDFIEWLIEE